MKVKVLKLNEQEESALVQLLDVAVKAGGLKVAEAAIFLASRLISAPFEEPAEEDTESWHEES